MNPYNRKEVSPINIFKQLVKSLFSPKDIASYRSQGIGKTILFVFLLTLLSIIPTVYYTNTALKTTLEGALETIAHDLPEFTIENGRLHSSETQPITVNKGNFSIIFDSTGSIDSKHISSSKNTIAFLQTQFAMSFAGEVSTFPYSIMAFETIKKQDIETFIASSNSALMIFLPVFAAVIYLFSSGAKFIQISILALLGLILKNLTNRPLGYGGLWRMSAYSVTLPTLFFTIMALIQTQVPYDFLINWFVSLTMLLLAIQEVPPSQPKIS